MIRLVQPAAAAAADRERTLGDGVDGGTLAAAAAGSALATRADVDMQRRAMVWNVVRSMVCEVG